MSTLRIREYETIGDATAGGNQQVNSIPVADEPGDDQTALTFSSSAQSAAFAAGTHYIAFESATAFHYVVGADPTATTNALRVPAETLLFIGVTPGHKIAAIDAA